MAKVPPVYSLASEGSAVGPLYQVAAGVAYVNQFPLLAVGDDGDDEAFVEGDGDADVHVGAADEAVVLEVGVEGGVLLDGEGAGLDNQVVEADADALGQLPVQLAAELGGAGHVYLGGDVEVGGLPHAARRAGRDEPPHGAEGDGMLVVFGGGRDCFIRQSFSHRFVRVDDAEGCADGDGPAGGDVDASQGAADGGFQVDDGLVRLNLDDDFAPGDGVAGGLQPSDDAAFLHLLVQQGHFKVYGWGQILLRGRIGR